MNARNVAGFAAVSLMLGGTAAVLSADAPRERNQGPLEAPPPAGARGFWSAPRPPGVPPDRWIPVNGELGIVIVEEAPPAALAPREPIRRALSGYFVVRRAGRWWPLLTTGSGSLVPLAAASSDRAQD